MCVFDEQSAIYDTLWLKSVVGYDTESYERKYRMIDRHTTHWNSPSMENGRGVGSSMRDISPSVHTNNVIYFVICYCRSGTDIV